MPDGVEKPAHREIPLLAGNHVFDPEVVEEIAVALAFGCDGVPEEGL
jgi:hypothetical protein